MIRLRSLVMLLLLLSLMGAPIFAGPVHFPDDPALSLMTEADTQLLRQAAGVALNATEDGVMVHWENPETGAAGVLTPLSTSEQGAEVCRQLELFSDVADESGRSLFNFCRQPDASWRVSPTSAQSD